MENQEDIVNLDMKLKANSASERTWTRAIVLVTGLICATVASCQWAPADPAVLWGKCSP
jgi:hypothetical protein